MINNNTTAFTANRYNTIPHHDFNNNEESEMLKNINLKMDNAKDKMTAILHGLNQLLVIVYH
jgi:hypothetical protein